MSEYTANLELQPLAKSWKTPSNGKAAKPAPARVPLFVRLLSLLGL